MPHRTVGASAMAVPESVNALIAAVNFESKQVVEVKLVFQSSDEGAI